MTKLTTFARLRLTRLSTASEGAGDQARLYAFMSPARGTWTFQAKRFL